MFYCRSIRFNFTSCYFWNTKFVKFFSAISNWISIRSYKIIIWLICFNLKYPLSEPKMFMNAIIKQINNISCKQYYLSDLKKVKQSSNLQIK